MKRKYYNAFNIILRDKCTCQDCHNQFSIDDLVVHHVDENPLNNDTTNLVTLCRHCHHARHGHLASKRDDIAEMRSMGMTFQEIGDILGITHQRVQQIYARNLKLI